MDYPNSINIPTEIVKLIKEMHPSDHKVIAGVFSLLKNEYWRDTNKIYFGIVDGEETWAVAEGAFTVAFIEKSDSLDIIYLNKRSKMHPNWL